MKRIVCIVLVFAVGAVRPLMGSDKPAKEGDSGSVAGAAVAPTAQNAGKVAGVEPAQTEEDLKREQAIA